MNLIIKLSFFILITFPSIGQVQPFICISKLLNEDQWHNKQGRTFNEAGVSLTDGEYHPVNACHYALFCYDKYMSSGIDKYKQGFLNQVRFLRDSNLYSLHEDKVGYPYKFKFHDLPIPWYSALAQAEAICVLTRYYYMHNDSTVLPLIKKVRNFLVANQSDGMGTKSTTPEGDTWYELYPNSRQEKHVYNAFLITVYSLYEYAMLFPEDTLAKQQYYDALQVAKNNFQYYDTGSWVIYNRGDKRQCPVGHMKWQTLAFQMLFSVSNDSAFYYLSMLTSVYQYNIPYINEGSLMTEYNFSALTFDKDGFLVKLKPQKSDYVHYISPIIKSTKDISITSDSGVIYFKAAKDLKKMLNARWNKYHEPIKSDTAAVYKFLFIAEDKRLYKTPVISMSSTRQ